MNSARFGIPSMIVGVVSLALSFAGGGVILACPCAVVAISLGIRAWGTSTRGYAVAGVTTGVVTIVLFATWTLLYIAYSLAE